MSSQQVQRVAGEGRTMWRRSALVLAPGLLAVGAMSVAMAQGALAAGLGVASENFSISGTDMQSTKLALFPTTVKTGGGETKEAILLSQKSMSIRNMCLVSKTSLPVVGNVALVLRSGEGDDPVEITNFVSNASLLDGQNGVMSNATVGQDASTLDTVDGVKGGAGQFGIGSDKFSLDKFSLDASSVAGGSFKLAGLKLGLQRGDGSCS